MARFAPAPRLRRTGTHQTERSGEQKEREFFGGGNFCLPLLSATAKFRISLYKMHRLFIIFDFWCSIKVVEGKYNQHFNSTTILVCQTLQKHLENLGRGKGLSQEKLARLTDVANNTIIKIEAGKNQNPTLDILKKIASALEINVDELIK